MRKYFPVLKSSPMFASIHEDNLDAMLGCLGARVRELAKDSFALAAGDKPEHIGVLLEGRLQVAREDAAGGRALLAQLSPGDCYGEVFVCAGVERSPVGVLAVEPSVELRLDFRRILSTCSAACEFHRVLIENMVGLIARKNLMLQNRMDILGRKSIRERLLLYLAKEEKRPGEVFIIPFDRSELAEYLASDRSALSREMSKLRADGVIDFHKSAFKLLRRDRAD